MSFGDNLKYYRSLLGLTQQQVADSLEIQKATYSGYETGRREPDVEKIKALAELFGVSGDDLLGTKFSDKARSNITQDEFRHLKKYRRLPDTGKQAVESMIDTMLAAQPEPQDRLVPVKVSGVMDIPGDYVAPESALKKAQERMTPVVAAAFGDDGSEPQLRMVSEEAVYRAAEGINRLMAESEEADRERAEADARTRAAYAQDKKKKRRK